MRSIGSVCKWWLILLFCSSTYYTSAQKQSADYGLVTLEVVKQNVDHTLENIRQQSGCIFIYNREMLQGLPALTLRIRQQPVKLVLQQIEEQTQLRFIPMNGMLVVHRPAANAASPAPQTTMAPAEARPLSGRVVNRKGEALDRVTVYNKRTGQGSFSDSAGYYSVPANPGDELQFSFVGYYQQALKVSGDNSRPADIILSIRLPEVEEVIVSGYQQLRKKMVVSGSTITSMQDFLLPGTATIDGMLQGRVAGLAISNTSGGAAASPRMRIRGTTSFLGNNQPVWVVDGIVQEQPLLTLSASQDVSESLSSMQGNAIAGLHPLDIESISFLKDASASAIYGVQAANGVIVITTKKGGSNTRPVIRFYNDLGVTAPPRNAARGRMTAAERLAVSSSIRDLNKVPPGSIPADSYEAWYHSLQQGDVTQQEFNNHITALSNRNTDWAEQLFHTAFRRQQVLQVSGTQGFLSYFGSIGSNGNQGVLNGENLERTTADLRIVANPGKQLQMDFKTSFYSRKAAGPYQTSAFDYAWYASRTLSSATYYPAASNSFTSTGEMENAALPFNFLEEQSLTGSTTRTRQWQAQLNLRYRLSENLEYNNLIAFSVRRENYSQQAAAGSWYAQEHPGKATATNGDIYVSQQAGAGSTNWRQTLQWTRPEQENAELVVLGGTEFRHTDFDKTNNSSTILSAFSTANYVLHRKYVLNGSARVDASNQFYGDRRTLPSYSIGAAWRMAEEAFLQKQSLVKKLDLRMSWGLQGSILHSSYGWLQLHKPDPGTDPLTGEYFLQLSAIPNGLLTWERTVNASIGIDLQLFTDRLQISADVYRKKGNNLLLDQRVPLEFGTGSLYLNSAGMLNRGFECMLSGTPVRTAQWEWQLSLVYSRNINRAGNSSADRDETPWSAYLDGTKVVEGKPVGGYYAYTFTGLNPENGLPLFFASQDDAAALAPGLTLAYAGSREPVYYGGLESRLRWKHLRFQVLLSYAGGNYIRLRPLYPDAGRNGGGLLPQQNLSAAQAGAWRRPGDEKYTSIPALAGTTLQEQTIVLPGGYTGNAYAMYDLSDARLAPGAYLRCNNILVGYELNAPALKRTGLKSLELHANAGNFLLLASRALEGQDPETGWYGSMSQPLASTFSFGFTASF